jgi:hypothetical protein
MYELFIRIRNCVLKRVRERYSLLEALLFPKEVTVYERYAAVKRRVKGLSVLEIGGSSFATPLFFPHAVVVEKNKKKARRMKGLRVVIADACALPFKSKSFDCVVALDVLEHVEKRKRSEFVKELKRVARKKVVLTFPAVSKKYSVNAAVVDRVVGEWYRRVFRKPLDYVEEHIKLGYPDVRELNASFVEARFNVLARVVVSKLRYLPLLRLLAGLLYLLLNRKKGKKYYLLVEV